MPIAIKPKHPGAHHFYIHVVETSFEPEKGLFSAQLFDEGLTPGAGHLVHMPSHIYIRTGDYHKGTMANIRAVKWIVAMYLPAMRKGHILWLIFHTITTLWQQLQP